MKSQFHAVLDDLFDWGVGMGKSVEQQAALKWQIGAHNAIVWDFRIRVHI